MKIQRLEEYFLTHKNAIFSITLILLLGLLPVTWFRGDYLIIGGDFDFSLSPLYGLYRHSFAWDMGTMRESVGALLKLFPYQTFMALSSFLGLSLVTSEKIFFYILFTLPGLSMYYLTLSVMKRKKDIWLDLFRHSFICLIHSHYSLDGVTSIL